MPLLDVQLADVDAAQTRRTARGHNRRRVEECEKRNLGEELAAALADLEVSRSKIIAEVLQQSDRVPQLELEPEEVRRKVQDELAATCREPTADGTGQLEL